MPNNSEKIFLDAFSAASVKIIPKFDDAPLASATGFFYTNNGETYLVSNWHVFSGRNRFTGYPLNKNGSIPNWIEFSAIPSKVLFHDDIKTDDFLKNKVICKIKLDDEETGLPLWRMHQSQGQNVDIAVIKLQSVQVSSMKIHYSNSCKEKYPFSNNVGADAFVVGFPFGISTWGKFPIWKRATIASERRLSNENGLNCFLIDCYSMTGLSGSPVYLRNSLVGAKTLIEGRLVEYAMTELIGVYSGRMRNLNSCNEQENETFLGEVWDVKYIDEIIENGIAGDFTINSSQSEA